MSNTTYISIDVEADGPVPGLSSMLSLGAAAFHLDGKKPTVPVDTFSANLVCLHDLIVAGQRVYPMAKPSEDTMAWWATQPEAWAACRKDPEDPTIVMHRFVEWCRSLGRNLIVIGYPVTYDFMWVYWYTMAFGGLADGERCPFGFQGLDLKTLAAEKLRCDFRDATKRRMPRAWFHGAPKHNHEALTDAIGQGIMFVHMMSWHR